MVYNTRNRRNDATESQKEKKTCLMLIFGTVSQKSQNLNNIYISICYYSCPGHLVRMFCGTASMALFLARSKSRLLLL